MRIPFFFFALAACRGSKDAPESAETVACDLEVTEWSEDGVVSPSPQVRITNSPWIPVMVHFPTLDLHGATSESWLDCQPLTGAVGGVLRPRSGAGGGGLDFLTTLDTIDLEPGEHTLVHRFASESGDVWVGSTFEYDPPEALVTAQVADSDGEPVYARIVVLRDNLPYDMASPDGDEFDPKSRDNMLTSLFAVNGVARVRLEPGTYRFVAARGPLDTVESQTIEVVEGDNQVSFTIDRSVKTSGWSAGDFHVHTGASFDAYLPDAPRVYSLVAAGLDAVVPADHDVVRDFDWTIETILGEERSLFAIPGTEATILVANPESDGTGPNAYKSFGHTSVFPLDPAKVIVVPEVETTLADHLSRFRVSMASTPYEGVTSGVLQLNHPRGIQERPDILLEPIHDLFNKMGFDPTAAPGVGKTNEWMGELSQDGTTTAFDYDALEIMNRGSWEAYNQVRLDWLGLLSWGRRITGTGNSDSHAMAIEQAGFPTNMVPCKPPGPKETVDVACWTESVKAGRLVVTTGPFIALSLTHQDKTYGLGEQFTRQGKDTVHANVRVRAAPWVPVPEVRLVMNGLIVRVEQVDPGSRSPDEPFEETYIFPVPALPFDTYVVAEAGWSLDRDYPVGNEKLLGDYAVVAPGYLPMAFTNPIWIDEDGDGKWTGTGIHGPPKKQK
jgi:hypothetical protein